VDPSPVRPHAGHMSRQASLKQLLAPHAHKVRNSPFEDASGANANGNSCGHGGGDHSSVDKVPLHY
jgi:hypothetical protein